MGIQQADKADVSSMGVHTTYEQGNRALYRTTARPNKEDTMTDSNVASIQIDPWPLFGRHWPGWGLPACTPSVAGLDGA
jgi:hypothetical protein